MVFTVLYFQSWERVIFHVYYNYMYCFSFCNLQKINLELPNRFFTRTLPDPIACQWVSFHGWWGANRRTSSPRGGAALPPVDWRSWTPATALGGFVLLETRSRFFTAGRWDKDRSLWVALVNIGLVIAVDIFVYVVEYKALPKRKFEIFVGGVITSWWK